MTLPINIKFKVLPRFPAQVIGREAITVTKQNGIYYFDIDYSNLPLVSSIPPGATPYTLVWDPVSSQYLLIPLSSFTYVEAPNDGTAYGRQSLAWVHVLAMTGGTLTGPLILQGDPASALGAATKQYVDAHSGPIASDAPSDGFTYGRLNAAWTRALALAGGTLTGALILQADPSVALGAATKQYVDGKVGTPGIIPENSQSANYTLVLGDAGQFIYHPATDNNARTFTIPANASVAYTIGTVISFVNMINTVTIAITTDTMTLAGTGTTGSRTLAANGTCTAIKIGTTAWIISGTGLT
jgi:hypothetical protein